MESNAFEISVGLGNLPGQLKSLGDAIQELQTNINDIKTSLNSFSSKHETMLMKQSVLSVEVQECDTRCVEFLDGHRNLEIQMNSLDLQVKTVSSAEMDNSLRIDQIASVSKTLEKEHIDIMHGFKLHSLKVEDMLAAARNSENCWVVSSDKVQTALSRFENLAARTNGLQEQVQSMFEEYNSRNLLLNERIESALREIDAKCQSRLSELRHEPNIRVESFPAADQVAKVTRMYQRIIGDLQASRTRDTFACFLMQEWRSETLRSLKRKIQVRRVTEMVRRKLMNVFDALRFHSREVVLVREFHRMSEDLKRSNEAIIHRVEEFSQETQKFIRTNSLLEDKLASCLQSLDEVRKSVLHEQPSNRVEDIIEQRFLAIEERLLERFESQKSISGPIPHKVNQVTEVVENSTLPQIQDMLKDLLMLWNSLKELDAKKVDKSILHDEISSLASEFASIKAEMIYMKNILDQQRSHWASTSTVASLHHVPSNTFITQESEDTREVLNRGSDVEQFIDLAKSILSNSNHSGYSRSRPSRPTSKSGTKTSHEARNTNSIQIVARKLV